MINVTSDPSANGWRGETFIEIGHRRMLVHTSDDHADPDAAEQHETDWAFQAFAAFFQFLGDQEYHDPVSASLDALEGLRGDEVDNYPSEPLGAAEEPTEAEEDDDEVDLDELSVAELRALAAERGIELPKSGSKDTLIDLIVKALD